MAIGETAYVNSVREQLLAGRARLSDVMGDRDSEHVLRLLDEVDSALHKIDHGEFGVCEICRGMVEEEQLRDNPLARVCLDCLTPKQQRALEYDLELAAQIQKGLLPAADFTMPGWHIGYHYAPAGVVSGDYCDLINNSGELFFVMADVSGKGVAAAMLSSNLRAIFRSLIPLGLPSEELMKRANRLFRQNALPSQYATVVFGRTEPGGDVEIVNAGHLPVFVASGSGVSVIESTNAPVGLFEEQEFTPARTRLQSGDAIVLYTDGASETENDAGEEYGVERLRRLVEEHCGKCPAELIGMCREQLMLFRGHRERFDDETLLAIQYAPAAA